MEITISLPVSYIQSESDKWVTICPSWTYKLNKVFIRSDKIITRKYYEKNNRYDTPTDWVDLRLKSQLSSGSAESIARMMETYKDITITS